MSFTYITVLPLSAKRGAEEIVENPVSLKKQKKEVVKEVPKQEEKQSKKTKKIPVPPPKKVESSSEDSDSSEDVSFANIFPAEVLSDFMIPLFQEPAPKVAAKLPPVKNGSVKKKKESSSSESESDSDSEEVKVITCEVLNADHQNFMCEIRFFSGQSCCSSCKV